MGKYRVVIADDNAETLELLHMTLELDNYEVIVTHDGKSALEKVREIKPDIVLLDYDMPGLNGHEVCSKIKADRTVSYIPVIILSGTRTKVYDKINGLEAGADDYMIKPFDTDELRARVLRSIQKTKEIMSLNPLTKLPGSTRIEEEITKRLENKTLFAVGYIDLDHFKAYNDMYGYKKGDDVIHLLHEVTFEASRLQGNEHDFIGHIGGDDFIIVTTPEKIDAVCSYITKNFDLRIPAHYSQADREKGGITSTDRQKHQRFFPIMTVSIGVSSNEKRAMSHYAEVIDILIEMKKYAKALEEREGSTYVKDKRESHTKTFS